MDSVFEPLFIDTNIEYELDMSRFPGWEDPARRFQPKLLIHQPDNCVCSDKHQDLISLLDSYPDIPLEYTDCEDYTKLENYREESCDIVDHLLYEISDTGSNHEGAHLDPISTPVLPLLSDDSGIESLLETLSEFDSSDDFICENTRKRKVFFGDKLDDLPCKRALLDNEVYDLLHSICVDYSFSDMVTKGEMCRGS